MTIAKRLIVLLAVPLLALLGLGLFTRLQLANIEERSRFVAESQVESLALLGNLARRSAPVLGRKAKDSQATDPKTRRGLNRALKRLDPCPMAKRSRQAPRLGPTAIAIHDYGDMQRRRGAGRSGRLSHSRAG